MKCNKFMYGLRTLHKPHCIRTHWFSFFVCLLVFCFFAFCFALYLLCCSLFCLLISFSIAMSFFFSFGKLLRCSFSRQGFACLFKLLFLAFDIVLFVFRKICNLTQWKVVPGLFRCKWFIIEFCYLYSSQIRYYSKLEAMSQGFKEILRQ
jgi:hypothetical protein